LNESAEVWKLLGTAPLQLDRGSRGVFGNYLVNGYVVWDEGVAIVTRPWTSKKTYYGLPGVLGGWQVMQLVASTKGNGSALRVMRRWHLEMNRRTFLFVMINNDRGIAFYKKLGYSIYTTIDWGAFKSHLMYRDPI
jgi:hypothetical protein